MDEKVVLITGASSGVGKACAEYLSKKKYRVYGTSRNPVKTDSSDHGFFQMIVMDVDDDTSVHNAVSLIIEKEKRIDVVVNNAGWGISGAVEEVGLVDAKHLFETNFFGILRIIKNILPVMRQQKKGLIINISSIGGVLGLPFQGLYCATKFAVEGLSEALRMEVKEFGVDVVLVEPGDFKTDFTCHRKKLTKTDTSSAYYPTYKVAESIFEKDEMEGSEPILIAHLIEKIIASSHPRLRYRVGALSQRFAASLKGVVPDRLVQWILMKYYKLI